MSENTESRLRNLEKRLEVIEKAIRSKMICPDCGGLLTLHEQYENIIYKGKSHAQCYHCGFAQNLKEPVSSPDEWRWRRGQRKI